MREWRNWQTRTFEGRVVHTVRVQVPFLAKKDAIASFFIARNGTYTVCEADYFTMAEPLFCFHKKSTSFEVLFSYFAAAMELRTAVISALSVAYPQKLT